MNVIFLCLNAALNVGVKTSMPPISGQLTVTFSYGNNGMETPCKMVIVRGEFPSADCFFS